MEPVKPSQRLGRSLIAVALSWGAGLVDVVGYLVLDHAFVAHMTGNTVSTVLHGLEHNWPTMLHRGAPIPTFFVGLLLGEIVLEAARRRKSRCVASHALWIEAVCLALFVCCGLAVFGATSKIAANSLASFLLLLIPIAAAMGIQSAALRKVGALTIFTTFITGTLTKLASDVADYIFWFRDQTRGTGMKQAIRLSPQQECFQAIVLLTALYCAYAGGALSGVLGFHHWGVAIVSAPLLLVLLAILVDQLHPLQP